MDDAIDETRTVNAELLRYLGRLLANTSEVDQTTVFPANKQETLVVSLDTEYYPEVITDVRLEIRAYTNGAWHVSYIEQQSGDRRQCRWDRHDNSHNTRDHFHPLPAARTDDAHDREFPTEITTLLETVVLPWVESRLGTLWERE